MILAVASIAVLALFIASYIRRGAWIVCCSMSMSIAAFIGWPFILTIEEPRQVQAGLTWLSTQLPLGQRTLANLTAETPIEGAIDPDVSVPPAVTTDEPSAAPASSERASLAAVPTLPASANDGTTRFGIEIGSVDKQDALRPLWREYLTNHAALVAGLQARRVQVTDKKWRLIAGPFANAVEAAQVCLLFKKAARPCETTLFAGDAL